jgi:hypothetical protein
MQKVAKEQDTSGARMTVRHSRRGRRTFTVPEGYELKRYRLNRQQRRGLASRLRRGCERDASMLVTAAYLMRDATNFKRWVQR